MAPLISPLATSTVVVSSPAAGRLAIHCSAVYTAPEGVITGVCLSQIAYRFDILNSFRFVIRVCIQPLCSTRRFHLHQTHRLHRLLRHRNASTLLYIFFTFRAMPSIPAYRAFDMGCSFLIVRKQTNQTRGYIRPLLLGFPKVLPRSSRLLVEGLLDYLILSELNQGQKHHNTMVCNYLCSLV